MVQSAFRPLLALIDSRNRSLSPFIAKMREWCVGRSGRAAVYTFTEHGAVMAAHVLSSASSVHMSVIVVRAFIRLREALEQHRELSQELRDLRRAVSVKFDAHDQKLKFLLVAIDRIQTPGSPRKRRIGF